MEIRTLIDMTVSISEIQVIPEYFSLFLVAFIFSPPIISIEAYLMGG